MTLQNEGIHAAMLGGQTNAKVGETMEKEVSVLYCNHECLFNSNGEHTPNLQKLD